MLRLDEIEKRAKEATEGPWKWEDWNNDRGFEQEANKFTLEAPAETRRNYQNSSFPDLPNSIISDESKEISVADKDFIAHSREDVPYLVAMIKSLSNIVNPEGIEGLEKCATCPGDGTQECEGCAEEILIIVDRWIQEEKAEKEQKK